MSGTASQPVALRGFGWLGITAFAVLAVMLSLLIFIGEAVRDAFDPRKTFK